MAGTIRKIAQMAHVSPATVSRYFSGQNVVSDELSRRIEEAANTVGYVPNHPTRKSDGVIVVLIPNLEFGYFSESIKEIIRQMPKYKCRVIFLPTFPGDDSYKSILKELYVMGVIYLEEEIDREVIRYIRAKNIKVVMLGGAAFDSRCDMVHINDMMAAWVTSLMLGAMIGESDEGEQFMNTMLPTDYNTKEFIDAATRIQTMFQKYTTPDAVGGKYENAASNFFMGQTAIIANGPWMISDFYDTSMVEDGFADKVGTAMYPGDVMYNSGKIGFNVASKDEKTLDATLTFVKFLTNEESQLKMLEITGDIPAMEGLTSDNVKPLVNEVIANGDKAAHSINDFQSLWYANVVDEISIQYPLLAQGEITPEEFAQALTDAAQKN